MTTPQTLIYFEDLEVGAQFPSPITHTLSVDDIIAFAHQYDPQPFHTDPNVSTDNVFGGHAASGWHTAVTAMRQFVDMLAPRVAGGLVGLSIDKLRWPRPTRAGDTLRVTVEVLGKKRSSSKPNFGVVQLKWWVHNQEDQLALELENAIWVACRSTQD